MKPIEPRIDNDAVVVLPDHLLDELNSVIEEADWDEGIFLEELLVRLDALPDRR